MGNKNQKNLPLPIDWDTSVPNSKLICQLPVRDRVQNVLFSSSDAAKHGKQTEKFSSQGHYDKAAVSDGVWGRLRHSEGSSTHSATSWKPDIYADTFVPDALIEVNRSPASVINTPAINGIDFPSYISAFAGSHFLSTLEPLPYPKTSEGAVLSTLEDLSPLNYGQHFEDAFARDLEARIPELRSYNLFGVPFEFTGPLPEFISLNVPGLRDGTPFVSFGDTVMIRQLIIDPASCRPRGMDAWLAPGGGMRRGEQAPGFTGCQMNAVVTGIDKIREKLFVRAYGMIWADQLLCNVSFTVQNRLIQSLQRAIAGVAQELYHGLPDQQNVHASGVELEAGSKTSSQQHFGNGATLTRPGRLASQKADSIWLQRVLFPEEVYGIQQTTLPSAIFPQSWFDVSLNYQQKVRSSHGYLWLC